MRLPPEAIFGLWDTENFIEPNLSTFYRSINWCYFGLLKFAPYGEMGFFCLGKSEKIYNNNNNANDNDNDI